jgi:predicted Zn-dependent protease
LLLGLSILAVGLFFGTKALARTERGMERRDAQIWYDRGNVQTKSGNVEGAIDSYRQALANDRDNRTFALALADALARGNHPEEARETLLRLRDSDPEDPDINLAIARLEASAGHLTGAVDFYQNALYGHWKGKEVDERRRQVRVELVRFLLDHHQSSRALSELLILETDFPETASAKWKLAHLFLAAGDTQKALKYFDEGLQLEPRNPDILAEAAETAFRAGDYFKARHYLETAVSQGNDSESTRKLLSLTENILSLDPLLPRLSMKDRRVRLLRGLDLALSRAATCIENNASDDQRLQLKSLSKDAATVQHSLQSNHDLHDIDDVRSDWELIYQIEDAANTACGKASGPDLAVALISRSHGIMR